MNKKTITQILGIFLLVSFVLFSCKKKKKDKPDPDKVVASSILPTEVVQGTGSDKVVYDFLYEGSSKKLKKVISSETTDEFTYSGNKIAEIKITYKNEDPVTTETYTYSYDNEKLSRIFWESDGDNDIGEVTWVNSDHAKVVTSGGVSSELYFNNGNIIKVIMTFGDGRVATEDYQYDDKQNPYVNIVGIQDMLGGSSFMGVIKYGAFSKNNVTKDTNTYEDNNGDDQTDTYSYSYEYNKYDFPTKMTGDESATFTYNIDK